MYVITAMPIEPCLAKCLLSSLTFGCTEELLTIAAMCTVDYPFINVSTHTMLFLCIRKKFLCVHVHIHTHTLTHMRTQTYINIHTHIHIHIHIHAHTHIHTHRSKPQQAWNRSSDWRTVLMNCTIPMGTISPSWRSSTLSSCLQGIFI